MNTSPVLRDDAIYLGDNGRCLCGEHSGYAARFTGRDLSGQQVHRVTSDDQVYSIETYGVPLSCNQCGRTPM